MTYLKSEPLLTPRECLNAAKKVKQLRSHWIPRGQGTFHTIGASTYNDDPAEYPRIAFRNNPLIIRHFGGLIQKVSDFFSEIMAREVVILPTVGLAGFHIFDHTANGIEGHIHIDEPFKRIDWPCKVARPFTFTLPVELPTKAGLNVYPDIDADWFAVYDRGGDIDPPAPQYYPYETGVMYWHSGLLPHQIANPVTLHEGQYRITLQGHGVLLDGRAVCLYF